LKRRSCTKASKLPDPTYFVDRNLGKAIVKTLREAGFSVEAHDDHFPQKTPDTTWIPVVAQKGWIALTKDRQIAKNAAEIDAFMTSGGRAFLPHGMMKPSEFGLLLVRSKDRLNRYLNKNKNSNAGPFMTKIGPNPKKLEAAGLLETWVNKKVWMEKVRKRTRG